MKIFIITKIFSGNEVNKIINNYGLFHSMYLKEFSGFIYCDHPPNLLYFLLDFLK